MIRLGMSARWTWTIGPSAPCAEEMQPSRLVLVEHENAAIDVRLRCKSESERWTLLFASGAGVSHFAGALGLDS